MMTPIDTCIPFDYSRYSTDVDVLREHIKNNGLKEPLLVIREKEKFRVIHGNRRLKALQLLRVGGVEVIVYNDN